jgi:hypothetical protein
MNIFMTYDIEQMQKKKDKKEEGTVQIDKFYNKD